jgi:hypothetical protein
MSSVPTCSSYWPADNPATMAHVDLLQGIINRLANNSASCKTWCLGLVAAFIGLAGASKSPGIASYALLPVLLFGCLDAMYLAQERAYRQLFRKVVDKIRTGKYVLGDAFETDAQFGLSELFRALLSWSVFPIYLSLIVAYVVARKTGWV